MDDSSSDLFFFHSLHCPHPGGVTCLKVAHARNGMEMYSCGNDHTIKMWRIVMPSQESTLGGSDSGSAIYLEHFHTVDATTHGMFNLKSLEVSQTPDVGAAWYAASHGHHAVPSKASTTGVDKLDAKKTKRARGSRTLHIVSLSKYF